MRNRLTTTCAVLGLTVATVSGSMLVTAGPASADLVTRCVGHGGAVTVPGDLVVPEGKSCDLEGTVVAGDVRVGAGADLIAADASFHGRTVVAENGYLRADDSQLGGRLVSRSGFGAYLVNSELRGDAVLQSVDGSTVASFLYPQDSVVDGAVKARTGQVVVDGSEITDSVINRGGAYVDSINSVIGGSLAASDTDNGTAVCDSEIYGDAAVTGNSGLVRLGANDPSSLCEGATFWAGSVTVSDNAAPVRVSDNIIGGDLAGRGNAPEPTGEHNRVRGQSTGQFADLQAPTASSETRRGAALEQSQSPAHAHQQTLRAAAEKRGTAAQADARAAGPAQLS